jgi:hypothetical protein
VLAPGSRNEILLRRESRRPFARIGAGDAVRVRGRSLVAHDVTSAVEQRRHVTRIFTRAAANVVPMPESDDGSIVAQFIRFHVLVRVFDGNPDAWLEHLRACGDDGGDVRFARWIRARLRHDPMLIGEIRRMVDATPFWRAAEA